MSIASEEGLEFDEYLDEINGETAPPSEARTDDEMLANWALRKIALARAELARKQQVAANETARVTAWLDGEAKRLQARIDFFTGHLIAYHLPLFEADPKHNRTIKLPCGTLQFRKPPARFERDDGALLGWLESQGLAEFVKDRRDIDWVRLKSQCQVAGDRLVLKSTGELIDGVSITQDPPQFKVITSETEEDVS